MVTSCGVDAHNCRGVKKKSNKSERIRLYITNRAHMVLQTPPACRTSNSRWLPSTSALIGLRQPAVTEAPPLTSLTYDRPIQDAALQPRGTSFHRLANKYNYYLFLSPLSNINNNSQDNNLILRIWKREEKRAKLNLFDFIYWIICVCVFPCARRSFTERIGLIRGCKQFSNQQKNIMLILLILMWR